MTPDEIINRLKELGVPHAEIATAIGRERTAATKLLSGVRRLAAGEIAPLLKLVTKYEGFTLRAVQNTDPTPWNPWDTEGFVPKGLPVRGVLQAGAWLELDPQAEPEPELYPALADPRYPRKAQWLARVRGDSMNALTRRGQPAGILDGDLVQLVDAIAIDYEFQNGDVVEVERIRFSGREREYTLKQVEVAADGTLTLWPRSTNPRWAEPVAYKEGDEEDVEVRVRGKVISHIRPF